METQVTGALANYLQQALARSPAALAGADGAVLPEHLIAQAQAIAGALSAAGIAPAEPVLAVTANRPADLATMLGIWLAGGVVVPLHADAAAATADGLQRAVGARLRVAPGRIDAVADTPPPERDLLRGAALVIFTSGSTGRPKGVVIGHDRLAAKLAVLDRLLDLSAQDKVVVPLQLTFIFGIWVSLLALHRGARLVLVPKFTPEALARALGRDGTVLAAVPTMLRAMTAARLEAAALRAILTGGELLPAALGEGVRAAFPRAGIWDLYGLTETGSCDFCLPAAGRDAGAGSIGRPTEGVAFRVIGEDGRPAPDGATGELAIRTPFGMLGYLDDPALTAASFRDGYFGTGDLARVRSDGRVEIAGRLKDIISRGGNKIAPAEIDALLCAHPGVAAALTAGVPDERLGEAIWAIVVPEPGAALTADALRAWAAERIERYKVPDAIHFRDALPLGPTGKVQRAGVARAARSGARGER
jgi:long-chain acyl-CoA synthetase